MKPEETRKFVEYSFRDSAIKTTGTDIDKILPPVSRFGDGREQKKASATEKLEKYFTCYYGIG